MANNTHVLVIDITLDGKFIKQLGFPFCPLFPIGEEEIRGFVEDNIPTLKGKDFKVRFVKSMKKGEYNNKRLYRKEEN
jgi:hypothetical protein